MGLTREQLRQLVRATVNQKDFDKLKDTVLNQYINFAVRQVQNDLMTVGSKTFIKQRWYSGSSVTLPSDLLSIPNSILSVKASGGQQSYGNHNFTVNSVLITVIEPGQSEWAITFTHNTAYTTPAITAFDYENKTMTIAMYSGTTTGTAIEAMILNDPRTSNVLDFYFTLKTLVTLNSSTVTVNTDGGSGAGWVTAKEISIEEFDTITSNTYRTPTLNNVVYKRSADYYGVSALEFLPRTVTYSLISYYYRLTDSTADSDTIDIPDEYEELIVIAGATRCYSHLKARESVQEKIQEYDNKINALVNSYKLLLDSRVLDKTRLQSIEPKN